MKRVKRELKGESIVGATMQFRSSIHAKLEMLTPPGCTKVQTLEYLIEHYFLKKSKKGLST